MEACASAHYWAREIQQLGHRVRLVNPPFVKPYVKANKNDASDAEAICEAASRPSMRFVPVKTAAQLEVQTLHRVRQQLVKSRTALVNQVRGLALILEDADHRLSGLIREILSESSERLKFIEARLHQYELHIERLFRQDPRGRRLAEVPGVRPLIATCPGGGGRQCG
jgi:transposase